MAISKVQTSTRGTSSGPSLTVAASFSSLPTAGNYVVAVVTSGSGKFGSDPTGWTLTDNQSGNTYTLRATSGGQGNRGAVFTAPVVGSSGTFTVTATVAPGGVDSGMGLTLIELSPLDGSSLVDLLVQINDEAIYSTNFNVTTSATDFADEYVIALSQPRGNGSYNASPSPAVPPSGFSTVFKVDSGDGAGYCCDRITTVTGAQSIDFSGLPSDGSPGMLAVSFRGASAAAAVEPFVVRRHRGIRSSQGVRVMRLRVPQQQSGYVEQAATISVDQVTETDTAQAIQLNRSIAVGQVQETDTSQAVTARQTQAIGQVSETDTALAVAITQSRTVGQVTETDAAQAVTSLQPRAVAQVSETDTAQAIATQQAGAIGQVSETDAAQAIAVTQIASLGQVSETDTAQSFVARQAEVVAQVTETDTAQAIAVLQSRAIEQVQESDTAQGLSTAMGLAQVVETDTARDLSVIGGTALGQASEADTAQPIALRLGVLVEQVAENDEAFGITLVEGGDAGAGSGAQWIIRHRRRRH